VNSWKIILATIVIFGVGVITGGLLVNHVNQTNAADSSKTTLAANVPAVNVVSNQPPRREALVGMEQRRLEFMGKVSHELNLSPQQKTNIDTIIHDQQEQIKKIWEPVWESISPKLREQMTNAHEQIVAELTPEQRQKFEELMKRPPPKKDTNQPPKKVTIPGDTQSKSNIVAPLGAPAPQNP